VGVKKEDLYSHPPHQILPGLPRRGAMGVGGKAEERRRMGER